MILGAQRALRERFSRIRDTSARLSSGRRITRSADDPAGLALSEGMEARSRSRRVALRNTMDGLSLLDTADGGLAETANLLKRARELAVQASSDTVDSRARSAIAQELEGVLDALDHVAYSTTWNNNPLLSKRQVDVGMIVDVSGSMGGEIAQVKSSIEDFVDAFADANLDVGLGLSVMGPDSVDGLEQRADINDPDFEEALDALSIWGVGPMDPYTALMEASGRTSMAGTHEPDRFAWRASSQRQVLLVITDTGRETSYQSITQAQVASRLANMGIEVHTINPSSKDSTFSTITSETGGSTHDLGNSSGSGIAAAFDAIAASFEEIADQAAWEIQVDIGSGADSRISSGLPVDATVRGLELDELSVDTAEDARAALSVIDEAMDTVNGARAGLGARTRRLEHALSNGETALQNEQAARSRIVDADMASETAALAKDQLLAKAGLAVLAQANSLERLTVERLLEA
jgi:flagellin